MIVKCQKPITSNEASPPVLVYNEDRSFRKFFPFDEAWDALFSTFGLESYMRAKFYAEAHEKGDKLVIEKAFKEDLGW